MYTGERGPVCLTFTTGNNQLYKRQQYPVYACCVSCLQVLKAAAQPRDTWGPALVQHRTGRYDTLAGGLYHSEPYEPSLPENPLPRPPTPPLPPSPAGGAWREVRPVQPTEHGSYVNAAYVCGEGSGPCPHCGPRPTVYDVREHPLYAKPRSPTHKLATDATCL